MRVAFSPSMLIERAMEIQKLFDNQRVKHPIGLLHLRNPTSNLAQNLIPLILAVIQKTLPDESGHYFLPKSLFRAATRQGNNADYAKISRAFDEIYDNEFAWNIFNVDKTVEEYGARFLISRQKNAKRGTIGFQVHPEIEKVVKNPKLYSFPRLIFIFLLAEKRRAFSFYNLMHAILSIRGVGAQEGQSIYPIAGLKQYLAISEESYPTYKEFKKQVLKPLVEFNNAKTNLLVEFEGVRMGRSVTHVRFMVKERFWQLPLFIDNEDDLRALEKYADELVRHFGEGKEYLEVHQIQQQLEHKGAEEGADKVDLYLERVKRVVAGEGKITREQIQGAIEVHGESGVEEILEEVDRLVKLGKVKHRGRYLTTALKEGYGVRSEEEKAAQREQEGKKLKRKQSQERHQELQEAVSRVETEFVLYLQEEGKERFLRQDEDRRKEIEGGFLRGALLPSVLKAEWREQGQRYSDNLSKRLKSLFCDYAARTLLAEGERSLRGYCTREKVAAEVVGELKRLGKI